LWAHVAQQWTRLWGYWSGESSRQHRIKSLFIAGRTEVGQLGTPLISLSISVKPCMSVWMWKRWLRHSQAPLGYRILASKKSVKKHFYLKC
jgi:hypothetical protein